MRTHEIRNYESVLEVLESRGCPICGYLKDLQAKFLQREDDGSLAPLCNFHTWGTAAVCGTDTAARTFLAALGESSNVLTPGNKRDCWICERLASEENRCVTDIVAQANENVVLSWLKRSDGPCLPHGSKLRKKAAIRLRGVIEQRLQDRHLQLRTELMALLGSSRKTEQGGVLGRAAEFLVSQRGLR